MGNDNQQPAEVACSHVEPSSFQQKLESLQKAITVINHLALELDILAAMDNVNDVALELLDCERVTLFLIFERRQELRGKRGKNETPEGGSNVIRIRFGEGIAGTVAQTGKLMNIADAYSHPLFNRAIDKDTGFHTRTILGCAISDCSGRRVAVLQALNKSGGKAFSVDDEYHLQLVGTHLGNTLSKARLHEQATREKQRLAALHNTFRHLATADDLAEVLDRVTEALQRVIYAEYAFIFLVDAPRCELWTNWWDSDDIQGTARVAFGEGVVGLCADDRAASCISNMTSGDPVLGKLASIIGTSRPYTNMLVQPVLDASSNRVLAVILAVNKRENNGEADMFFEEQYNETDCEASALFALELADILVTRSLEVALASALSIVDHKGGNASAARSRQGSLLTKGERCQSASQLQTQLINLYFPISSPDRCSPSSSFALIGAAPVCDARALRSTPGRSASLKTVKAAPSGRMQWQSSRRLSITPTPLASPTVSSDSSTFFAPDALRSWELDFTHYGQEDLIKMAYDIFMLSGLVKHFKLSEKQLRAFLSAVASHYNPVPYHNFNHVMHVLHGTWLLLESAMSLRFLTELDGLALLIAAICHDLDHDGHSNSYHVNAESELSRIYNDVSVMENHHCAMAFAILNKKECNLFEPLSKDERRSLRKNIIATILSTDMSKHYMVTQDFRSHSTVYFPDDETDRHLLTRVLLHAADIGSGVRPFDVNQTMSRRVHMEFQAQAEQELSQGLPVTFSINTSDSVSCCQVELNFLDYVVAPLWERLVEVLPDMAPQYKRLTENRNRYQVLATTVEACED